VKYVIDKVTECGGIEYATNQMNQFRQNALNILKELPETPYRNGLENLVNFVTDRKY
jgi:octaprenyl-diphosphate synthase